MIDQMLKEAITIPKEKCARFFKTGPGQYAQHEQFLGVRVPDLRRIAKQLKTLSLDEIETLLESPFNEKRFLALILLVDRYQKGKQEEIYHFYLDHLDRVSNWNLVDASAHLIVGAHLIKRDKAVLLELARSHDLWRRRVAIVATWFFIRKKELDWTFKLAEMLLGDEEDLMHKAVGWMLREAGKKDEKRLRSFLKEHEPKMPRTMYRYAIEHIIKCDKSFRSDRVMKCSNRDL